MAMAKGDQAMRVSFQTLLRTAFCSWIAAAMLAVTPAARGQSAGAAAPTVGGPATQPTMMRFKKYVVTDEQGFKGMEVLHGLMPADWTMKGGVTWKMALVHPDLIQIHWGDAQDVCAFDMYPMLSFAWGGMAARNANTQRAKIWQGNIIRPLPGDQFDAIEKVIIPYFRPDLAKAKVVSKEKLPDVARAVDAQENKDPSWPVIAGAGKETFEYDLHGQTVQEVVRGVVTIGGDNSQRGLKIWQVVYFSSWRAPKGTLDQMKPINAVMQQSFTMNQAWVQHVGALIEQRKRQALRNQQTEIANSTAAFNATEARISAASAAEDAQDQAFDQHMANIDKQSDAEADYQREVSPWTSGDGSTYKLPTAYSCAWQGADGQFIMNNNAGYNPNQDPSLPPTNWTPMQQAGN